MDWLFDNLGKLAPLVIFALYMISSLKRGGGEQEADDDPEAAERARKIQEEIRRKILERQREAAPPSEAVQPPPLPFEEEVETYRPTLREERLRRKAEVIEQEPPRPTFVFEETEEPDYVEDPYVARRKEIEKKLAASKKMKAEAAAKAKQVAKRVRRQRPTEAYSRSALRSRLIDGLGDSSSLKAAVVLKEVLDKPIGLR